MHTKRTLVIVAVEAERAALGAACLASPAVRVVVAGIGRTNAAAATAEALAEARAAGTPFAAVVSAGIAGALPGSNLAIGTVIVADACIYAEEGIALPEGQGDMRVLGFPLGDFEGNRVPVDGALVSAFRSLGPVCEIATVATCSGTDAAAHAVRMRTGAMAEAMEGAAVVHAARRAGVPAIEIRSISNTTGDRPKQQWNIAAAFAALGAVGDSIAAWSAR
jgi:futalosine hydrolase